MGFTQWQSRGDCLKELGSNKKDKAPQTQCIILRQRSWIFSTAGGLSWRSICRPDTAGTRACLAWRQRWPICTPPSSGCSRFGSTCGGTQGSGSSGWLSSETGSTWSWNGNLFKCDSKKKKEKRKKNIKREKAVVWVSWFLHGRVLFGERPFWWVQETRFYGSDPVPSLQQFPITCETGPGTVHNRPAEDLDHMWWLSFLDWLNLSVRMIRLSGAVNYYPS